MTILWCLKNNDLIELKKLNHILEKYKGDDRYLNLEYETKIFFLYTCIDNESYECANYIKNFYNLDLNYIEYFTWDSESKIKMDIFLRKDKLIKLLKNV